MAISRLEYLFDRYVTKTANEAEEDEFLELVDNIENKEQLEILLRTLIKETDSIEGLLPESEEAILEAIFKARPPVKVIPIKTGFQWKKIAVAASIILAAGLGSYFIFFDGNKTVQPVTNEPHSPNDVSAPDVTKATLKLDNGTIVYLDSADYGSLAIQGNVNVVKTANGQISYQSTVNSSQITVSYNTISNPRGSKIQSITLIDGTRIWLNAESSLTYPTAFVGNERKISITGEAYFEVAKDASKKFIVDANGVTTEVLGTHFNVNAYNDERDIKVSLLEGSVRVSNDKGTVMLKPGEQARIIQSLEPHTSNNIDVEQVMAWKNGLFSFKNSDLPAVMRQVSRWYDVDVIYEGPVPDRLFGGEISRMNNVSKVLKVLEESQVTFRIEGKRIVVLK